MLRKIRLTFLMLLCFCFYVAATILCKQASEFDLRSFSFVFSFCSIVMILGIYAILWQKVLSVIELNKAYLCKSSTLLIILASSHIIYGEEVTTNNIIGASIITVGLFVLAWNH